MKLQRLFWSAAWWRALLEGLFGCLALLGIQLLALSHADERQLGLSVVVIAILGATLAGLRARPLAAPQLGAAIGEASLASLLALAVGPVCTLVAGGLSSNGVLAGMLGAFLAGGTYLFWRAFRVAWEALARLRRRRFVWSLMFSFMLLIVAFIYLGVLLLIALAALFAGVGSLLPHGAAQFVIPGRAVDARLAHAQHVDVRAVQYQYLHNFPSMVIAVTAAQAFSRLPLLSTM
jgi:hypothetical protein